MRLPKKTFGKIMKTCKVKIAAKTMVKRQTIAADGSKKNISVAKKLVTSNSGYERASYECRVEWCRSEGIWR